MLYSRGGAESSIFPVCPFRSVLTDSKIRFGSPVFAISIDMRLDLLRFAALENDCDIAMYGHTHVPYLEEDPDDVTILNPGSISKPRQADHRYTYMVMEIDDEDEVTYELRYVE